MSAITGRILDALDPDKQIEAAQETGQAEPAPEAIAKAAAMLLEEAAKPLAANPDLRKRLVEVKRSYEQVIDTVSKDELTIAGHSEQAREKAEETITSFRQFIEDNKDEILALQALYSKPYKQRLTYTDIKDLADAIKPPAAKLDPGLPMARLRDARQIEGKRLRPANSHRHRGPGPLCAWSKTTRSPPSQMRSSSATSTGSPPRSQAAATSRPNSANG